MDTDMPTRVARLDGACGQMDKRLSRIEAELLIVIGAVMAQLGGTIAILVKLR
jgi:hypothetical protein